MRSRGTCVGAPFILGSHIVHLALPPSARQLRKDEPLVRCLLEFGAEASKVNAQKLWESSAALVRYDKPTMYAGHGGEWAVGEWYLVLEELVGGYDYHMNVRGTLAGGLREVLPTWTDLTMWSVLIGEPDLAHTLWRRSRMPLRAALMASQFCRLMAGQEAMVADSAELADNAARFEQWALDLLDEMPQDQAYLCQYV